MTENPNQQTTQPTPVEPKVEPVANPVAEPAPEVDTTPFAPDGPETEVELVDEENLELEENQFDDLDEELTDVYGSADTIWLLRRVGIGIFKVVVILGGLGFLVWLIWGDNQNIRSELRHVKEVKFEESVGKIKDKIQESLPESRPTETPAEKPEEKEEAPVSYESQVHFGGLNLASWNYWLETQRLQSQAGTPGDVMRWKRDTEAFFEIPLLEQIKANNAIERNHKITKMLQRIDELLLRAQLLQQTLTVEIADFTSRSRYAQEQSLISEQQFLDAMTASDPTNIGHYLNQKAEAEKNVQIYAVAAEGRRIFAEKIAEYSSVLDNVKTAVTVNRQALAQDIQVVNFPSDPFGRVIPLESWQPK